MGKLDYLLILRWLDDLALPQYKDAFADARVDGRTLNCLTTVRIIHGEMGKWEQSSRFHP